MVTVILLLCIAMGAGLQVQAGVNSRLAHFLGSPIRAATISFLVGFAALLLVSIVATRGSHTRSLGNAPWWVWFGGLFGAFYVTVATIAVPRIGAVPLALGVLAGQVGISLALDQWGLLGFKQHAITPLRVVGVAFVATGVTLVRLF